MEHAFSDIVNDNAPPAGSASATPHSGMRLEDLVRTAAPYCLKAEWSADVDREMVLLQVRAVALPVMYPGCALVSLSKLQHHDPSFLGSSEQ
jgi:hypothetical protein